MKKITTLAVALAAAIPAFAGEFTDVFNASNCLADVIEDAEFPSGATYKAWKTADAGDNAFYFESYGYIGTTASNGKIKKISCDISLPADVKVKVFVSHEPMTGYGPIAGQTEVGVLESGSVIEITDDYEYVGIININTSDSPTFSSISFTWEAEGSGVESIVADNSEAVYYNLQGARVENPENGMFIRVQNGKSTKVAIK